MFKEKEVIDMKKACEVNWGIGCNNPPLFKDISGNEIKVGDYVAHATKVGGMHICKVIDLFWGTDRKKPVCKLRMKQVHLGIIHKQYYWHYTNSNGKYGVQKLYPELIRKEILEVLEREDGGL